MEQAHFVLELLCGTEQRMLWVEILAQTNLDEGQLQNALRFLNSQGYVAAVVRLDLKMTYSATLLGRSVAELATGMPHGAGKP